MKKRYQQTQYAGIRKDLSTGCFQVCKSVNGVRRYKNFRRISEAKKWWRTFSSEQRPLISDSEISHPQNQIPVSPCYPPRPMSPSSVEQAFPFYGNFFHPNTQNPLLNVTFAQVWDSYQKHKMVTMEESTKQTYLKLAKTFDPLLDKKIFELDRRAIADFIIFRKEMSWDSRRISFDAELKLLKSIFNWFLELNPCGLANPIIREHFKLGTIRSKKKKEKKLNEEEFLKFLAALKEDSLFWYDFAIIQFFCASRVQEPAGIQVQSVDLKNRELRIENVAVWGNDKKFLKLKPLPKNGEDRVCYINDQMMISLVRRLKHLKEGCDYVFHDEGQPLGYRAIQYRFNKALKKAGLNGRFSGTHLMRHTMATLTRKATGNLDVVQAITGHKDSRMAQHYAALSSDVQRKGSLAVLELLDPAV